MCNLQYGANSSDEDGDLLLCSLVDFSAMDMQSGNHTKALWLYMNTLKYFKMQLKYVTDRKIKEAIKLKLI